MLLSGFETHEYKSLGAEYIYIMSLDLYLMTKKV
jgi:hypothetical protein